MNRRRYAYLSSLVLLATSPFPALAVTDNYIGPNNDFWNNAANWDNGIPSNNANQTFDVLINSPTNVFLNTNATINSLTLASSASLSVLPSHALTLAGPITNSGTLLINGTTSASTLYLATNSTLTGAGTLLLTGASSQISGVAGARLTTDNLITGQGSLGLSNLKFTNSGTINASTGPLAISPASGTDAFYNTGTLLASGNGLLNLNSGTYQNAGGTIEALDGRIVSLTGTVIGGSINGLGGTIRLSGSGAVFQDVSLAGTISTQSLPVSFRGVVDSSANIIGTPPLNTGVVSWSLAGTLNNTGQIPAIAATISGNGALTGSGEIVAIGAVLTTTDNAVLYTSNLITGLGNIGGGTLRFVNNGTIEGSLTLSPLNAADGFVNHGVLEASNSTLTFDSSIYTNTGGLIETLAGGVVVINGTVNGGTLLSNGLININASSSVGPISGSGTVSIAASITLISDGLSLNTLQISGTHVLSASSSWSGTSELSSLLIASDTASNWTGQLDLNNNALILLNADTNSKATTRSTLISQIASGKNNGTNGPWTGTGITSSTVASDQSATGSHNTTLALVDNAELGATTFRGQTGLDSNSLIITQALLGDVDLSGSVGFADLLKVAQDFGQTGGWAAGNMDGPDNGGTSATVDFADLLLVAQHFGETLPLMPDSSLSPQSSSLPAAPVPEPASLSILAAAAVLLRRRRK